MKFKGFALALSAFAFAACGGGEKANSDSAAATTTDTAASTAATPTPTPDAGTAATPAGGTGTVHTVNMVGDASGYKFEPATLTIKPGDTVKWVMVSGGPHNVAFDAAKVGAAKAQLVAAMPNQMAELTSPMLTQPNEVYQATFANVPAGSYEYVCQPHAAMNMKGTITVQ
jgi:plastocyanin